MSVASALVKALKVAPVAAAAAAAATPEDSDAAILRIPWSRAQTRLADLAPHAERMKKVFDSRLAVQDSKDLEHAVRGILSGENKLQMQYATGTGDSVEFPPSQRFGNYLNHKPITERKATFDFHTHPRDTPAEKNMHGSSAQPSLRDIQTWRASNVLVPREINQGLPAKVIEYLRANPKYESAPGTMRGNQENIIAAPDEDYFWWTLPKDVGPEKLKAIRPADAPRGVLPAQEDYMARILFGAKKGDWDVQTSFDPREYGVR